MTASAIGSPLLKARAPLAVDPTGPVWFDVALMQKDLRLALDAARALGVPLPSGRDRNDLLTQARRLGYDRRDIASVHEVLADLADERCRTDRPRGHARHSPRRGAAPPQ